MKFKTAQEAFEELYPLISNNGIAHQNTKASFNVGFLIENPLNRDILTPWRKWSKTYAEREWQWYISGNPNAENIAKFAPIWKNMMDSEGNVNSNYGYQWNRGLQVDRVVNQLKADKYTRKAAISLFDGKEFYKYSRDTICTYALQFTILDDKLCMTVLMRSNDLVFGFCNDQYCFSKLQELIANQLGIKVGWYYHFATNLHIYERHYNLKNDWDLQNN